MSSKKDADETTPTPRNAAFETAMAHYESGVKLLRKSDFNGAREMFLKVPREIANEPELSERAATYVRICERKNQVPDSGPVDADGRYYRAVMLTNQGDWDAAIQLLNEALAEEPASVNCLYVRASAWALKGTAEKAVSDLREAIAIDPTIRFQAINDPDFEKIREEPSFIDIIEPTPTGV